MIQKIYHYLSQTITYGSTFASGLTLLVELWSVSPNTVHTGVGCFFFGALGLAEVFLRSNSRNSDNKSLVIRQLFLNKCLNENK